MEARSTVPKLRGPGIGDSPADEDVGAEGGVATGYVNSVCASLLGAFGGSDNRIHPEPPTEAMLRSRSWSLFPEDRQGSSGIPSAKELADGTCLQDSQ
jgi:hypothetical protein